VIFTVRLALQSFRSTHPPVARAVKPLTHHDPSPSFHIHPPALLFYLLPHAMYHHNQEPSLFLHDYILIPRAVVSCYSPCINWPSAVHSVLRARFPASSTQPVTSVFEKMAVAKPPTSHLQSHNSPSTHCNWCTVRHVCHRLSTCSSTPESRCLALSIRMRTSLQSSSSALR
jgi:hypothetical protein